MYPGPEIRQGLNKIRLEQVGAGWLVGSRTLLVGLVTTVTPCILTGPDMRGKSSC